MRESCREEGGREEGACGYYRVVGGIFIKNLFCIVIIVVVT